MRTLPSIPIGDLRCVTGGAAQNTNAWMPFLIMAMMSGKFGQLHHQQTAAARPQPQPQPVAASKPVAPPSEQIKAPPSPTQLV